MISLNIPGFGPLSIRKRGADLDLTRSVLGDGCYDVAWPTPALKRLEDRYHSILASGRRPVIVNAGGYIGLSALWFARRWPAAVVVSVEPDAGNLSVLRLNVGNRPGHVIVPAALGSAPGMVSLTDDDGCAVQTQRANRGVEIITVDDAVAAVPDGEPFVCNIDVEGFEKDLFAANTRWIDRFQLIIVEPHDWRSPGDGISANLQREMASRRFDMFIKDSAIHYLRV
ncbi:FkbM family methyltransferase [Novosphingobium sp. KCTC 2891]|nr:FkbM family methyltransferase [Novosphingobium sp. KCTC 2891]